MIPDISRVNQRILYLDDLLQNYLADVNGIGNRVVAVEKAAQRVAVKTFEIEEAIIRLSLKHPKGQPDLICRHKIIAATSCAIMFIAPLAPINDDYRSNVIHNHPATDRNTDGWKPLVRKINAEFALSVALDVLADWLNADGNEEILIRRKDLIDVYDDHEKWLYRSLVPYHAGTNNFPYFLTSQFWTMIERYCIRINQ